MKRDGPLLAALTLMAWLNGGALLAVIGGQYGGALTGVCTISFGISLWGTVRVYNAPRNRPDN